MFDGYDYLFIVDLHLRCLLLFYGVTFVARCLVVTHSLLAHYVYPLRYRYLFIHLRFGVYILPACRTRIVVVAFVAVVAFVPRLRFCLRRRVRYAAFSFFPHFNIYVVYDSLCYTLSCCCLGWLSLSIHSFVTHFIVDICCSHCHCILFTTHRHLLIYIVCFPIHCCYFLFVILLLCYIYSTFLHFSHFLLILLWYIPLLLFVTLFSHDDVCCCCCISVPVRRSTPTTHIFTFPIYTFHLFSRYTFIHLLLFCCLYWWYCCWYCYLMLLFVICHLLLLCCCYCCSMLIPFVLLLLIYIHSDIVVILFPLSLRYSLLTIRPIDVTTVLDWFLFIPWLIHSCLLVLLLFICCCWHWYIILTLLMLLFWWFICCSTLFLLLLHCYDYTIT